MKKDVLAILALVLCVAFSDMAYGDPVETFYKGKTITLVTSTGPGGPLDLIARTVARNLARHIPGAPTIIVQNMPGGGHIIATNYMYNQAPRDGTYIATVVNSIPLYQVINGQGARYDARKFNWLGVTGVSNLFTVAWAASGVKTIDDVMQKEVPTGATGVGSGTYIYTNAMNLVLGTKFKMILGYADGPSIDVAMERGEVVARGGFSLSGIKEERPSWLTGKKINMLVQVGIERDRDFPDVPLMSDLAKTDKQREVLTFLSAPVALGRPFFAPPDVPADRLAALRSAFAAMLKDPLYVADAKRTNIDLNSLDATKTTKIVDDTVNAPSGVIAQAKTMLGGGGAGAD